jgi:hypothetical protein
MKKLLTAVLVTVLAAFSAPAFSATNPFMDVPASHWAYDAITQLAGRGVISGYPDGSYKGAQPATRYEVASVIARSLAKLDLEKASKQDVEMLKKLIVEFKDELDALGVKVDQIDERLGVIETDIGGWSMAGELRFDAEFSGKGNEVDFYGFPGKNEFDLDRYRLFINKRIDENTNFSARLGPDGDNDSNKAVVWELYYVTTTLPYDISFTVGRQTLDLEGDLGFYIDDNDSWLLDVDTNALSFKKSWGVADFLLSVARATDATWDFETPDVDLTEAFLVVANVNANFSEKFRAGLLGYWLLTDDEVDVAGVETDHNLTTYGGYLGFKFTPEIELKGIYYTQKQGKDTPRYVSDEDSANAWKAILDVQQEALKFTSLWLEYGKMDNNFEYLGVDSPYGFNGADVLAKRPVTLDSTTIWAVHAAQQWNDKWRTYLRFVHADFGVDGIDEATDWSVAVGYRYSPAIEFELGYDKIDYGDVGDITGDDHLIRFRTFITF